MAVVSYQVFARKYRPQVFDEVVGQEHITRTLKNAIAQNRLAHAYLFVGPRGTGKTSTARILAKCLCCVQAPTVEPCGVCDACKEIAAGISLDVLEIDGASNNGVEQVRELRENVRYAPTRGTYKIYIIDEVHMLTSAAFNALLKTLEEPPEHVKFIFATTEVQKVLPTILSRCQRFDLRRIPAPLIAAHLQKIAATEKITLAPDAADAVARGAEGGLRDAESMLDQLVAFCGERIALEDVLGVFGFTAAETVARLASSLLGRRTTDALAVLDEQSEAGKDLTRLLSELITHLRNLLVFQVNPAAVQAEAGGGADSFQAQHALVGTERLLELIDGFAAAESRMKWVPNKKLHFEIALIKAIQSLGQSTLTEVIEALASLREGGPVDLPSSAVPAVPVPVPAPAAPAPAAPASTAPASTAPLPVPPAPVRREVPVAVVSPPSVPPPEKVAPPPPAAEKPIVEPAKPAASVPAAPAAPVDGPKIWGELMREIKSQRPLINEWAQAGRLLGVEGDHLRVGFPPAQKMFVESLGKAPNRKLLETILGKLAGRPLGLKLELLEAGDEVIAPNGNHPSEHAPAPPVPALSRVALTPAPGDPAESFKNDPLIQKALQIFEGEIRAVNRPV